MANVKKQERRDLEEESVIESEGRPFLLYVMHICIDWLDAKSRLERDLLQKTKRDDKTRSISDRQESYIALYYQHRTKYL